jgi:hypothetical protein
VRVLYVCAGDGGFVRELIFICRVIIFHFCPRPAVSGERSGIFPQFLLRKFHSWTNWRAPIGSLACYLRSAIATNSTYLKQGEYAGRHREKLACANWLRNEGYGRV